MEFRLDDGQVELQDTVARFCQDRFPLEDLAPRDGAAVDRDNWLAMAELGVFGLLCPADRGGSGLGAVEAAIVFEQLGNHLAPGPVLWTLLSASFVDDAATGEFVVCGVDAGSVVEGTAIVPHASDADALVVVGDELVRLYSRDEIPPPESVDPLDPLSTTALVRGLGAGTVVGDGAVARDVQVVGSVLTAALLAGVASRALDTARDHALGREQFGVLIGSFQAVKHMLADMYLRSVLAQSATYAAAALHDDPNRDDPLRAASAAKLLAADAAIENSSTAIQILGGMGFTWDMLPNYLLKRAWALEQDFGVMEHQEQQLASMMVSGS